MSKINNFIFLGGIKEVEDFDFLKKNKITHILSVLDLVDKPNVSKEFKHLFLEVKDDDLENIIQHFPKCHEFIEECISNLGKILVHCEMGISRSSTIVISYLMKKKQMTFKRAFKKVKAKRPKIKPNTAFVGQLEYYFHNNYVVEEDTYDQYIVFRDFIKQETSKDPNASIEFISMNPEKINFDFSNMTADEILKMSAEELNKIIKDSPGLFSKKKL